MIDKVVGKELFEKVEVAFALDLVCIATNDRLCGLADVICRHVTTFSLVLKSLHR